MRVILDLANLLVDGTFMPELDDDNVQWRGPRNQRPIGLRKSRIGRVIRGPVSEDWDTPVLTVTEEGDVVGAAGLVEQMFGTRTEQARMCGQTREAE
jgi:hypothetical protein